MLVDSENNKNIPSHERQALYDLYTSTNGDDWIYQDGDHGHWNFTDPDVNPCSSSDPWQGLNCTVIKLCSDFSSYYYHISEILLSNYYLRGTIPESIGNFSELHHLNLSMNSLIGPLPTTIGELISLEILNLFHNKLTGTLPSSMMNLMKLTVLNFGSNDLSGSIPVWIGNLSSLASLSLYRNRLTGTIPSTTINLIQLTVLNYGDNQLSGSIPVWIGNLSSLDSLLLSRNRLTGTISSSMMNLTQLKLLELGFNYLTGSIPAEIGELNLLKVFAFYSNNLQGTIPPSICNLTSMILIALGKNYFSGTIPSCVNKLDQMEYLLLDYNMLFGTIPSSLRSLKLMKNLSLCDNLLTGSIPNIFDSLIHLSVLLIQHNLLTGLMPISLADVSSLTDLFVNDNSLSGQLIKVFNGSHHSMLTTVQLSNNHFTGILPEQLFLSKSLQSMSAVSNCFHGTIPSSICMNDQLVSLALDGLVCASSCQTKILPGISSSYVSSRSITGGIPDCLWSMPKLKILHLSGNRLTGGLPSGDMIISSSLKDLSLSYNLLTGSIPRNIQTKSWTKLDLSHNRLSGTLDSNFTTTPSLSLTNNRLSGPIPRKFRDMRNIDILEGCIYDCEYDHSNLPTYDKEKSIYKCGSDTFNALYYIWLGIIAIVSMAIFVLSRYWKEFTKLFLLIRQWIDAILIMTTGDNSEIDDVLNKKLFSMVFFKRYISFFVIIRRISLYSTIFIIVVLSPTYLVISAFYHTHTYEYAWTLAPMYLSGKIAFGVVMISLVFFVMSQIVAAINLFTMKSYEKSFLDSIDINQYGHISKVKKVWPSFVLYFSMNLIVVGGVNIGYVLVDLYGSRSASFLCQILLSMFKLMWNNVVSPAIIRRMVNVLSIKEIAQQSTLFFLQFVISIFNNIIIPCAVVMMISPNCLFHVFQQEPDVISLFSYTVCIFIDQNNNCYKYENFDSTTSYTPPFIYSYQCSSDFITYYSPVFILFCSISTFIFPFIQVLWIRWKLPNILLFSRVFYPADESEVIALMHIDQVHKVLIFQLTLVGLLMTFGAIFPPLAVVFLFNILVSSYSHQAVIGRFLLTTISNKRYTLLDILEDDLKVQPMLSTIQKCCWFLLYTACCFYSFFLFDIIGNSVGSLGAWWVFIVMPCIPLCLYASYLLIEWIITYQRKKLPITPTHMDTGIQMNPLNRLDSTKLDRDSSIIDLHFEDRCSEPMKE